MYKVLLFCSIIFLCCTTVANAQQVKIDKQKCTITKNGKTFKLYGKVQIVKSFPDIKVQLVESFPDKCGKVQLVKSFPDVKVQIVKSFPDIKVKVVKSFPGLKK